MTKENILKIVNELPDVFELDMLLEKLTFIDKIQKGLEQIDNEVVIPHHVVKDLVKSWR